MILVDTSVWIDHLRQPIQSLNAGLRARAILSHEMVIGELACGNLPNRSEVLNDLKSLPAIAPAPANDVLALIEARGFMGRGIGYVDANLLGSVLACAGAALWTHDVRLARIAEELDVAHSPEGGS